MSSTDLSELRNEETLEKQTKFLVLEKLGILPSNSCKLVHFFHSSLYSCPLISPYYPESVVQFTHFSALLSLNSWLHTRFPGDSHLALVSANVFSSSLQVPVSCYSLSWFQLCPQTTCCTSHELIPLPVHLFHSMLLLSCWFPRRLNQAHCVTGPFFPVKWELHLFKMTPAKLWGPVP